MSGTRWQLRWAFKEEAQSIHKSAQSPSFLHSLEKLPEWMRSHLSITLTSASTLFVLKGSRSDLHLASFGKGCHYDRQRQDPSVYKMTFTKLPCKQLPRCIITKLSNLQLHIHWCPSAFTRNAPLNIWPLSQTQYKTTLFLTPCFPTSLLQASLTGFCGWHQTTFPKWKLDKLETSPSLPEFRQMIVICFFFFFPNIYIYLSF